MPWRPPTKVRSEPLTTTSALPGGAAACARRWHAGPAPRMIARQRRGQRRFYAFSVVPGTQRMLRFVGIHQLLLDI